MSDVNRRGFFGGVLAAAAGVYAVTGRTAKAQGSGSKATALMPAETISFPDFDKSGGMPLLDALSKRKTSRKYSEQELSLEDMSRILWACTGVNRADKDKRTTPSAIAAYPVTVYVALAKGTYMYDPKKHQLNKVTDEDLRKKSTLQPQFQKAPMLILYVADMKKVDPAYSSLEIGCMAQDVYLQAAAMDMGSCIFALVKKNKIREPLGLKDKEEYLYGQAVGYLSE